MNSAALELQILWADELDPARRYVVHCKGGVRSAIDTLLLRQCGFEAVSF